MSVHQASMIIAWRCMWVGAAGRQRETASKGAGDAGQLAAAAPGGAGEGRSGLRTACMAFVQAGWLTPAKQRHCKHSAARLCHFPPTLACVTERHRRTLESTGESQQMRCAWGATAAAGAATAALALGAARMGWGPAMGAHSRTCRGTAGMDLVSRRPQVRMVKCLAPGGSCG